VISYFVHPSACMFLFPFLRSMLLASVVSEAYQPAMDGIPAASKAVEKEPDDPCQENTMHKPSQTLAAFPSCPLRQGAGGQPFRLRQAVPVSQHPTGRWCSIPALRQHRRSRAFRPLRRRRRKKSVGRKELVRRGLGTHVARCRAENPSPSPSLQCSYFRLLWTQSGIFLLSIEPLSFRNESLTSWALGPFLMRVSGTRTQWVGNAGPGGHSSCFFLQRICHCFIVPEVRAKQRIEVVQRAGNVAEEDETASEDLKA
jgi:hypothetical protein